MRKAKDKQPEAWRELEDDLADSGGTEVVEAATAIQEKAWKGYREPENWASTPRTASTLRELMEYVERSIARCRNLHRMHLLMAVAVFALTSGFFVWALAMVTQGQLAYAAISGSAGVGGILVMQWKWQPFERATQALRLAECLEIHRITFVDTIRQGSKLKGERRSRLIREAAKAFGDEIRNCGT